MVRVLFILILLLETIFANSHTKIKNVNITEISKKEIPKNLEYNRSIDFNKWYKVTINKKSLDNLYFLYLTEGVQDYFLSANIWHKNSMLYGSRLINFKLDNNNTKTIYLGLKTKPNMGYHVVLSSLDKEIDSFVFKTKYLTILSIYFLMIGMIVMASLYSGTLYFYNRDKTFLYYSLMQFFMSGVLILHTNILSPYLFTYNLIWVLFYSFTLFTAFFATLFSYHFLKIKEYLPKYAKFFYLYLLLIVLDMLYYKKALLAEYRIYPIAAILFIVVGFLRLKQGFKPAKFYIVGWIILDISIAWVDYFYNYQSKYFNPLFLGAVIEAIMFAFAISYMVKETNLKKRELQTILTHKNKLASLGELLGNIAHQWRQPLATIGYEIMSAKRIEDKKSRDNKLDSASNHIEFLSQTINDFQNFYTVSKDKESFDVFEEIKFVISRLPPKALQDVDRV